MRQPNRALQADRRARILAAAVRCFGQQGFHQASMQDIAAEAGMSAANLYRYFASKEAIVDAIAEHEREETVTLLAELDRADDFLAALRSVLSGALRGDGRFQIALGLEIIAEAARNPRVAALYRRIDVEATAALTRILEKAAARGQIDPNLDPGATAQVLIALADAVFWRCGSDPTLDAASTAPTLELLLTRFLAPPGRAREQRR